MQAKHDQDVINTFNKNIQPQTIADSEESWISK